MERNENEEMDASETEEEVTDTSASSQHKNGGISNRRSPRTENKGSNFGIDNSSSCQTVSSSDTDDCGNPSAATPIVSSDGEDPSALPVSNEVHALGIRLTSLEMDPMLCGDAEFSYTEHILSTTISPTEMFSTVFFKCSSEQNNPDLSIFCESTSRDPSLHMLPNTRRRNLSAVSNDQSNSIVANPSSATGTGVARMPCATTNFYTNFLRIWLSQRRPFRPLVDVAEFCRRVLQATSTDRSNDQSPRLLPEIPRRNSSADPNDQSSSTDESSDRSSQDSLPETPGSNSSADSKYHSNSADESSNRSSPDSLLETPGSNSSAESSNQSISIDESSNRSSPVSLPETPERNSSADSNHPSNSADDSSNQSSPDSLLETPGRSSSADSSNHSNRTEESSNRSSPLSLPETPERNSSADSNDPSNSADESSNQSSPDSLPETPGRNASADSNCQSNNTDDRDPSSLLLRENQWRISLAALNDASNRIDNSRHQSLQALRFHMLRQLPSRSYEVRLPCGTHNVILRSYAEQLNHVRTHHGRRLQWPHICLECGCGFETVQELDDHKLTHI